MNNFKTKAFKIVSFAFMGFIIILIVVSFGMPNLGRSSSSAKNDFYVAKVGDEIITKSDVARIGQQLKARSKNASDDAIQHRAIEHNIYRKLFMHMMKQYGMYPQGASRSRIIAEYIRSQFPQYFENGKFNIKKFQDDYLNSRRISFSEMEYQIISEYAYNQNYRLFLGFGSMSSNRETEAERMISQTKISIQSAILDEDQIKKIALKKGMISEISIKEKFQKDFKKENTLFSEKRKVVIDKLYNEKKEKIQKDIIKLIMSEKNQNLNYIAAKYRMKKVNLKDFSYSTSFASKSSELAGIEFDERFQQLVAGAGLNTLSTPLIHNGKIYLMVVTQREHPKEDVIHMDNRNTYLFSVFDQMMEAFRNDTDIIRYSG